MQQEIELRGDRWVSAQMALGVLATVALTAAGLVAWLGEGGPDPESPTPNPTLVSLPDSSGGDNDVDPFSADGDATRMKIMSRLGVLVTVQEVFPNTVAIHWKGKHQCGGYLRGEELVVTAAHCVRTKASDFSKDIPAAELTVTYGLRRDTPTIGPISVTGTVVHEAFKYSKTARTVVHDIAVLRLAKRIVDPMGAPMAAAPLTPSTRVRIAGWGINEHDEYVNQLHCVEMTASKKCGSLPVKTGQSCIVDPEDGKGGQSLCGGDSGSPAYLDNGTVVAIVSSSLTGCKQTAGTFDVVTNLASYQTFITEGDAALAHAPETSPINFPALAGLDVIRSANSPLPIDPKNGPVNVAVSSLDVRSTSYRCRPPKAFSF